jgi:hypothetical protein
MNEKNTHIVKTPMNKQRHLAFYGPDALDVFMLALVHNRNWRCAAPVFSTQRARQNWDPCFPFRARLIEIITNMQGRRTTYKNSKQKAS